LAAELFIRDIPKGLLEREKLGEFTHLWTPGTTRPATAHLKATERADRFRPNRIMARGTKTAAKTTKIGEITVASVAAAAPGVTYT